jgi:uncharacterized protein
MSKPIEGVGTSIAAFVGLAPGGPVNRPIRVVSWRQFAKVYTDPRQPEDGPFMPRGYLAHAVHGFFQNGGRVCWIVRAGHQREPRRPEAGVAAALRDAIRSLDGIAEVSIIAVPDAMTLAGGRDASAAADLARALVGQSETDGARIAILDPPPDLRSEEVMEWRRNVPDHDSASATLYYPWIEVVDPLSDRSIAVPPSGHVAGIWARTAGTGGIHRAPTDAAVVGARGLAGDIRDDDQGVLEEAGVNSIRSFPGRGIRIWGARTLSSDPEWRYVSVRRLFIHVSESIRQGTRWVVFEANDEELWAQLRRSVSDFLEQVWSEGGLLGSAPEEAFYVKCDAETNPPDVIEAGRVVIEIGIVPATPAEPERVEAGQFVLFRVSQFTAGGTEVSG